MRLLTAIGDAADDGAGLSGVLSEFEWIVLHGAIELPDRECLLPGRRGYPRAWTGSS
ncbi:MULTISPECIES: hypothetical protein [unclassified Streptomyces]|uniref:hypothetical protein n=1 Tax=unclassified Streptomyces TaxID=2593676 RepID=UPI002E126D61|nr:MULTISPECIES: hypothetical protein [unclassified Streptomyces]WSR23557.1 hypothetical protein OG573_33660 [Streptomyces sp. NBC_01205]